VEVGLGLLLVEAELLIPELAEDQEAVVLAALEEQELAELGIHHQLHQRKEVPEAMALQPEILAAAVAVELLL
jgi:hypothetical protein